MLPKDTLDRIIELGHDIENSVQSDGCDPFAIVPAGLQAVDLKKFYPPKRIEQRPSFIDAGSFIEYVNRFKTPNSLIFASVTETGATFRAVLDYHYPPEDDLAPEHQPDYCAHVASFTTMETPEWKAWMAANRKPMTQVEFATWLEDNLHMFVSDASAGTPTPAELLELVRSLHGHQNARFNTALRLDNGAYSVNYEEDIEVRGSVTTKPGALELPKMIGGGFAVFQGGPAYAVQARLKTRTSERRLMLHFETVAVPQLVRENIMAVVKQIAEGTKISPLLGTP